MNITLKNKQKLDHGQINIRKLRSWHQPNQIRILNLTSKFELFRLFLTR